MPTRGTLSSSLKTFGEGEEIPTIGSGPGVRYVAAVNQIDIPDWIRGGEIMLVVDHPEKGPSEPMIDGLEAFIDLEEVQPLGEWSTGLLQDPFIEEFVKHASTELPANAAENVENADVGTHEITEPTE